jgi:hypothetical protein
MARLPGRVENERGKFDRWLKELLQLLTVHLRRSSLFPFPIPAHQTGRADFQHPAFRLDSSSSTRRRIFSPAELLNAKLAKNAVP